MKAVLLLSSLFSYELGTRSTPLWKKKENDSVWVGRNEATQTSVAQMAKGNAANFVAQMISEAEPASVTLTLIWTFCLTLWIRLRLAEVSELGEDFWLVGLKQLTPPKKQSTAVLRGENRQATPPSTPGSHPCQARMPQGSSSTGHLNTFLLSNRKHVQAS